MAYEKTVTQVGDGGLAITTELNGSRVELATKLPKSTPAWPLVENTNGGFTEARQDVRCNLTVLLCK